MIEYIIGVLNGLANKYFTIKLISNIKIYDMQVPKVSNENLLINK